MKIPDKYKFIVLLGKALHTYGVPSYKSQQYLTAVAKKKGIQGSFMDSPTWINYLFLEEDDQTYNHIECVPPGELNLGSLSKIVEVTNMLLADKLSFSEAKNRIKNIESDKGDYSWVIDLLSFVLSAVSFSLILNANWTSAVISGITGVFVYGVTLLSHRSQYLRSTLELMVAFIATITIGVITLFVDDVNTSISILASIILFVPGLSLTVALEEITSKSLVSGTAKLFDALISLFKQFLGVALGVAILTPFVDIKPTYSEIDYPIWIDYLAIALLALSVSIVFKVRRKELIYCLITGFSSFTAVILLSSFGVLISSFIGTIVTVMISKFLKYRTNSAELVFLVPGIVMLVPGSKAFLGLSSAIWNGTDIYGNMGFQVLYVLMGIIGGLILTGSFVEGNHD